MNDIINSSSQSDDHKPDKPAYELASRWSRLAAVLIDGVISAVASAPLLFIIYIVIGVNPIMFFNDGWFYTLLGNFYAFIVFIIINGYWLHKYGQTIGKRLCDIKIVTLDGSLPKFINLIVYRYAFMQFIGILPYIGWLIAFVGILMIYRKDKRCLHDFVAGTRVVKDD